MSPHLIATTLQTPSSTPNPGDGNQIDFTNPFDLIVFIILPICIAIFYFIWRRNNRKGDS